MPPSTESETITTGAEPGDGAPSPLRLSMTLPGSASLGAFQAGAMAALATAITSLRSNGLDVRLDAIGGSSAGSFVALLFTHSLLNGRDATSLLRDAWVDQVDIDLLRSGGGDAPLAANDLRDRIRSFLSDDSSNPPQVHPPLEHPVELQIGLTSLLGFTADIDTATDAVSGLSYVDWMTFTLHPEHEVDTLFDPPEASIVEAVMASASHPVGFSPRRLDRSADRDVYEGRGVTNFPDSGCLWYTDGGLIESAPVGRILAGARRNNDQGFGERLHLVVDPRSSSPSGDDPWTAGDRAPTWLEGLRRSAAIVPTQALHDDLRRVSSVNHRLRRLDELLDNYGDRLTDAVPGSDEDLEARRTFRRELAALGDLEDKEIVNVEVISPLLVAEDGDDEIGDLLAGDFIATFGGFLDTRIRRSDFALGWGCTSRWLPDGLARHGIDRSLIEAAEKAVDDARPEDLDDAHLEEHGIDDLRPGARWKLVVLAAQFGRVLISQALPSPGSVLARLRRLVPTDRD